MNIKGIHQKKMFYMEPNSLFQDSTGISGSSAVYSVTQRSVLNSSNLGAVNSGNGPSQLSVGDAQSHEQVTLYINQH